MSSARWHIAELTDEQRRIRDRLATELSISSVSASLLVRRGLFTAEAARRFIRPSLEELNDPFLMNDMCKAVDRLVSAIEADERILVYGDYDVDGTTAVALVYRYLAGIVGKDRLDYYIPDRYLEGYGISFAGIDYAQQSGARLIIALDCGIRSVDKVVYAKERGIDFIICDHHLPSTELPEAVAVLDAKRADNAYPYRELSGCGVGFKLMQAVAKRLGRDERTLEALLPFTAMSIASDIVPLTGENRVLAFFGLKILNGSPCAGINSLIRTAGLERGKINISDLVYRIGPRLNACGRVRTGRDAVRLLVTDEPMEADAIAEEVEANNSKRKDLDSSITNAALDELRQDADNDKRCATVVRGKDWHRGVVGIVASRLTETYFRPTIVFSEDENGMLTGSARSVGGFDIYAAIDSCSELLTNFGGHIYAAGLSLKSDNYETFRERFERYVSEHILPEQKTEQIEIEQELTFGEITNQFFKILCCLEPFGPQNPRPLFVTRQVKNYRYTRCVGKEGEHLRLDATDGTGALQGIGFGFGGLSLDFLRGGSADVCYELQPNTFNGKTTIQMLIRDIRML